MVMLTSKMSTWLAYKYTIKAGVGTVLFKWQQEFFLARSLPTSTTYILTIHTRYNQTITIDTTKQRSVALNADISQQQPKIFVISN